MEHVFITTSLNPTYEIQDESQNWLDSEIQENTIIFKKKEKSSKGLKKPRKEMFS